MATWQQVAQIAMSLPEVSEGTSYGNRAWKVKGSLFAWDRPLRKADRDALGESAPSGPILGVRVADQQVKDELLADADLPTFTIPHFDGYDAVLIRLDDADEADLGELITEAWLCRAPRKLARELEEKLGS